MLIPIAARCDCTPTYIMVTRQCPFFTFAAFNSFAVITVEKRLPKTCDNCKKPLRVIAHKDPEDPCNATIAPDILKEIQQKGIKP